MKALIIVDVQNDFCNSIPHAHKIIDSLNKTITFAKKNKWLIVASRDWHLSGDYCVKDTNGAEFNSELLIDENMTIISKESYSAFDGYNFSLDSFFKKNNIKEVYIAGLATDYCVKDTAIDSVKYGYNTHVIWDASQGLFNKKSEKEIENELKNNNVKIVFLKDIL